MTDANTSARATLEAALPGLVELSHRIYQNPELGFEEEKAAAWLADALEAAGFETQRGYGDMPTAVVGQIGSGPLHIVICSEYDASAWCRSRLRSQHHLHCRSGCRAGAGPARG